MWGSILIPAFLVLSGSSFVIGWAKPVPVNPYNLRNARWGEAFVAVAGPLSNLAIATIFGLAIRFGFVTENTFEIMLSIVMVNLVLAIFNLVPIPPMDGSKILFAFLPDSLESWRASVEKYGIIFAVLFIIFLWQYFTPLIMWLLSLLLGA
jgi:Zn-dependent protease